MNSRRGFFKRLAHAAAVIALAPQIAFKAPTPKLSLDDLFKAAREVHFARTDHIDIYTDRYTAQKIEEAMLKYYKEQYA